MVKLLQRLIVLIMIEYKKKLIYMAISDQGTQNNSSFSKKEDNLKNIEILKKDIKKLSYEESIDELEIILKNVQEENISLDKIQNNYIKGHILLKHCEELLQFVEQEINEINLDFLDLD